MEDNRKTFCFCFSFPIQEEHWPQLLALIVIPTTIQLMLLPWFPESPRYLLMEKNDMHATITGRECHFFHALSLLKNGYSTADILYGLNRKLQLQSDSNMMLQKPYTKHISDKSCNCCSLYI